MISSDYIFATAEKSFIIPLCESRNLDIYRIRLSNAQVCGKAEHTNNLPQMQNEAIKRVIKSVIPRCGSLSCNHVLASDFYFSPIKTVKESSASCIIFLSANDGNLACSLVTANLINSTVHFFLFSFFYYNNMQVLAVLISYDVISIKG